MGIFKMIARKFSMGPAVKVWTDHYNLLHRKTDRGLINRSLARDFYETMKELNIKARRQGDLTRYIRFEDIETPLQKTYGINYEPLLDLPSFLAVSMFFEISLFREAVREHPNTVDSILEIIYEVVEKHAKNGIISKKTEYMKLAQSRCFILADTYQNLEELKNFL